MANQLKILIVEDDFMIPDMAEEFLLAHGFDVCGIAGTVDGAVALGRLHRPDLAMIDYRLAGGGLGPEVAARLLAFGDIGILYATGNNSTDVLKDAVTALGIVVAELVTNSYDHAFSGGEGMIEVSAGRDPDDPRMAKLVIRDNGPGFKVNAGSKRHGLGLVGRLAEQVRGTASVAADKGTVWTISFPLVDPPATVAETSTAA